MEICFVPISKTIDRRVFDCDVVELNEYFQKYARQNHINNISKCFVAVDPANPKVPLGYYTTSFTAIAKENVPLDARLPNYPIPAIIIGRLAVDRTAKGKGIGARLLRKIFADAIELFNHPATPAFKFIVVEAKDEGAKGFYQKYGFVPFRDRSYSLLISMATVLAAS